MAQKARRDRRTPVRTPLADAAAVVGSEQFGSDLSKVSGMETAAVHDVTPAMMDEAAQRAAETVEEAAGSSVIEASGMDEEHPADPALPLIAHPVVFAPSEDQVGFQDASLPEEPAEAMPVSIVSQAEATIPSAPVEGTAASTDAEVAAVGEAAVFLAEVMPPVGVSTSKAEADEPSRRERSSPGEAIGAYGAQVVEMLAANIAANSHFLTALLSATSVTDVMAVNTNHLRRQMELLTTQRRQLTTLARTITFDAMKPFGATDHGRDR